MKEETVPAKGVLHIGRPAVVRNGGRARLTAPIRCGGKDSPVWFEVEERYGDYLCAERSDAFLIGLLNHAMREHLDIECEAPVGAQLLYQIRTYLVPALVRASHALREPKIAAEMDAEPMRNAGGVGTGISCGVDSFHVLCKYAKSEYPGLSLTHLLLNNVGSFWLGEKGEVDHQYEWQAEHARRFCKEHGFNLIVTDSNIAAAFPQRHYFTHTYTSCFAIYALQKLWSTYFYGSSGEDFSAFSLIDNDLHNAGRYDLLTLDAFSTRSLKIYSEGGAITRFEKMKEVIEYPPSYGYLHVCNSDSGPNCGVCPKCLRTLVLLDALGALDRYAKVLPVERYRSQRPKALRWLYRQMLSNADPMLRPAYDVLKGEIPFRWKVRARYWMFKNAVRKTLGIKKR